MCLSAFAVVKRGRRVLAGIPKRHRRWTSEWVSSWRTYPKKELAEVYAQTRLPATYLFEGESPDKALQRVMRDQLGIKRYAASTLKAMSYNSPSDWYPGNLHWDIAFAYDVRTSEPLRRLPWWSELGFLNGRQLRKRDLGWNSDFMKDLGLL
jgi:ADP-ribose pyrophosphatase YjhB (NUDIX family)